MGNTYFVDERWQALHAVVRQMLVENRPPWWRIFAHLALGHNQEHTLTCIEMGWPYWAAYAVKCGVPREDLIAASMLTLGKPPRFLHQLPVR